MAAIGDRPDIEDAIAQIADRLVRGTKAQNNPEILISRVYQVTTVAASTLTSIGLANPLFSLLSGEGQKVTVSQAFNGWYGLPKLFSVVGVIVFVVVAFALAFYREAKIGEKATQSLGLIAAFERVEVDLQRCLELKEPMKQIGPIYEVAAALGTSYVQVMPKKENCREDIDKYTKTAIKDYCKYWGSTLPEERSEK